MGLSLTPEQRKRIRGNGGAAKRHNVTLPFPPSANRYWRQWRGRMLVSREARAYKKCVAMKMLGMAPIDGDVVLSIDVFRPAKRGDLDNSLKVAVDSLRGFAYDDDKQIVEIRARRFDDKANPRVEVLIESAERTER